MWFVEFLHDWFGWLRYDRQFTSEKAARDWMKGEGRSVYRQRVRFVVRPCSWLEWSR